MISARSIISAARRVSQLSLIGIAFSLAAFAQLTAFQKSSDFQQLVGVFARRYALAEWKQTAIGFNSSDIRPWLERIEKSKDDLDFLEICSEYVASLHDTHSNFQTPSYFQATLGFRADIYDGKVLVDSVTARSGAAQAGVTIGDELVAVDGRNVEEWISLLGRYSGEGNETTARRFAAAQIPVRVQSIYPRAHEIADLANVKLKKVDGATVEVQIPWSKYGDPLISFAPLADPAGSESVSSRQSGTQFPLLRAMDNFRAPTRFDALGTGKLTPLFEMPLDFVQHAGRRTYDALYSGTFRLDTLKIGFLRIPSFDDVSYDVADELRFLADTDGLIVDVMRNPGGYGCDAESTAAMFFREPFRSLGIRHRVTISDLLELQDELLFAQVLGFPGEAERAAAALNAYREAYKTKSTLTNEIGICGSGPEAVAPGTDYKDVLVGYSKPVMVLTDELSASASELFAAILQDNQRVLIYGMRTSGAGGSVENATAGAYSETATSVTRSYVVRRANVLTPEYPASPLIENIGVRPDKQSDFMTRENLLQKGKPFLDGAIAAFSEYLKTFSTHTSTN